MREMTKDEYKAFVLDAPDRLRREAKKLSETQSFKDALKRAIERSKAIKEGESK